MGHIAYADIVMLYYMLTSIKSWNAKLIKSIVTIAKLLCVYVFVTMYWKTVEI